MPIPVEPHALERRLFDLDALFRDFAQHRAESEVFSGSEFVADAVQMPKIRERLAPRFGMRVCIPAAPADGAGAWPQKPGEHAQQRRFAAAVWTMDLQHLAGGNIEPYVAEEHFPGTVEAEFIDGQQRVAATARPGFRLNKQILIHR